MVDGNGRRCGMACCPVASGPFLVGTEEGCLHRHPEGAKGGRQKGKMYCCEVSKEEDLFS